MLSAICAPDKSFYQCISEHGEFLGAIATGVAIISAALAILAYFYRGAIRGKLQKHVDRTSSKPLKNADLAIATEVLSAGREAFRLGRIEEARLAYDKALPLYRAEQSRLGEANTL